ncbi:putative RNA-directed DNA polymerase domain protein [Mycobacterium kansasii 732]|nr:putative RNA-directed DNA polymerase domain protein [Mycobacterium kansasii 732]
MAGRWGRRKLTDKWARFTHPHKGRRWIVSRYFGAFHPSRRDRWVFGDRDSGAYWSSSPGRRSPGTPWSRAGRPRTTLP